MKYIDIHSHILPFLDDGAKSTQQSLNMLRIAAQEGIGIMIATPHNMPGKGSPSQKIIKEKIQQLQTAANIEQIPVKILLGTEYYYRQEVAEMLENDEMIPLANSECILVEFEPMAEKIYIRNAVREILGAGYRPVIAHVERYFQLMEKKFSALCEMKKMGALLQINSASVTGDNGRQAKKDTKNLLKQELVDFVATDAHSDGHRAPHMQKCAEILYKKYGKNYADALLYKNAEIYLL